MDKNKTLLGIDIYNESDFKNACWLNHIKLIDWMTNYDDYININYLVMIQKGLEGACEGMFFL